MGNALNWLNSVDLLWSPGETRVDAWELAQTTWETKINVGARCVKETEYKDWHLWRWLFGLLRIYLAGWLKNYITDIMSRQTSHGSCLMTARTSGTLTANQCLWEISRALRLNKLTKWSKKRSFWSWPLHLDRSLADQRPEHEWRCTCFFWHFGQWRGDLVS